MQALELKVPPALLMLLFGLMMWVIDHLLPQLKQDWPWHFWVARGVFLVAMTLIATGVYGFRVAKTTVDPTQPENASSVVTSGVYRFTRNPMYLGFLLILVAFMVKLANPLNALTVPLFVFYMNQFQIKPEERALLRLFGEPYSSYLRKVRRWI